MMEALLWSLLEQQLGFGAILFCLLYPSQFWPKPATLPANNCFTLADLKEIRENQTEMHACMQKSPM